LAAARVLAAPRARSPALPPAGSAASPSSPP
jgi:hypothetical protein